MRRAADPHNLRAFQTRGTPREPDGLRRYRLGVPGHSSVLGSFPHSRFCLDISLACPRVPGSGLDELRVGRLYRGLLPWLLAGPLDPATHQRWVDFVDLLDELMDLEDTHFASETPWPLADVRAIFREAADLLAREANPYTAVDFAEYAGLSHTFAAHADTLGEHDRCCREVLVNVHWW
jgi:hypothetical protein